MRLLQITLIVLIGFTISFNYHDSVAAAKASKSSSHQGHKSHGRSKGKKSVSKKGSGDVWERIRLGLRIPRPSPASPLFEQIASAKHLNMSATPDPIKPIEVTGGTDSQSTRLTTVITPSKLFKGESQLPEKFRARHILIPQNGSRSKADIISRDKYTPLGRLKLGAKESSTLFKGRLANKADATSNGNSASVNSDNLFKSPSVQRIRTRLGLHPELFKQEDKVGNPLVENKTGSNDKVKVQKQAAIQNCSDLNKQEIVNLAHQGLLPESYSELAKQCLTRQNANYERVSQHIAGYSQRKGALYQTSERARPYLYHIVDSLSKHNLPLDLALLPIVESAFQATALSSKDAAGIWQFIPSTGREYGLQQNASYDGRLDVTASTYAAIRFLSGLNSHYKGDWLLALAAYNSGQGTVDAAISRNQAEGLDTDFWSLDLPAETQDYVPRLLALSTIFENPGNYGLKLRPIKNEPHFIKVNIDRETDINHLVPKDLATIAKLADFDPGEFGLLNSAYLKSTITERKPFTLLMPISNANLLHESLAFMVQSYKNEKKEDVLPYISEMMSFSSEFTVPKIQEPLLSISLNKDEKWFPALPLTTFSSKPKTIGDEAAIAKMGHDNYLDVHYLDKGETLKEVAEHHGTSEEKLREVNKLKRRQSISLGQRLFIPLKQAGEAVVKKTVTSVLFRGVVGRLNTLQ